LFTGWFSHLTGNSKNLPGSNLECYFKQAFPLNIHTENSISARHFSWESSKRNSRNISAEARCTQRATENLKNPKKCMMLKNLCCRKRRYSHLMKPSWCLTFGKILIQMKNIMWPDPKFRISLRKNRIDIFRFTFHARSLRIEDMVHFVDDWKELNRLNIRIVIFNHLIYRRNFGVRNLFLERKQTQMSSQTKPLHLCIDGQRTFSNWNIWWKESRSNTLKKNKIKVGGKFIPVIVKNLIEQGRMFFYCSKTPRAWEKEKCLWFSNRKPIQENFPNSVAFCGFEASPPRWIPKELFLA